MEKEILNKLKLKKFQKREASSFFSQNLLYEYVMNFLDPERRRAVEENLNSDKNTQQEFIKLTNGLQYVELLSEVVVSDKIVDQIINRNTQLNKILNKIKFHQWPLTLRWFLEASMVILAMVITLNILPWNKIVHLTSDIQGQDYVLSQVNRKKKEVVVAEIETPKTKAEFLDEEPKTPKTNEIGKAKVDTSAKPPIGEIKPKGDNATKEPSVVAADSTTKPSTKSQVVQIQTPATKKEDATTTESENINSTAVATNGFLYRGQLQVTNVEMISPKIREKINEFGGRKAGEVEIGWKKSNQIYYYHFTMPQAKLSELEDFLKLYSEVKLKKEAHSRVMPDGIVRLIFTVEEKPSKQGPQ